MMVMTQDDLSNNSFSYEMPVVRVPNPPSDLSYAEYEDYRQREILKANGISISEADLLDVLKNKRNILQATAAHTLGAIGMTQLCANAQLGLFMNEIVAGLRLDVIEESGNGAERRTLPRLIRAIDQMQIRTVERKRQRSIGEVAVSQKLDLGELHSSRALSRSWGTRFCSTS